MKNFVLNNPTKIIFGRNTIGSIGNETSAYGKRVLFLFGQGSIKNNGVYRIAKQSLAESGCTITEFGGISPNPTLSCVNNAIKIFHQHNCEVICAVGGGSVIDAGKAVSCGAKVEHDVWKFFTTKKKIVSTIPLTCVSTLAASGSENNSGMVITNDRTGHKFGYGNRLLFPKVSILDPESTFSVSPEQTACGAADIISHLVEFYCNNSSPDASLQFGIITSAIKSVVESCHEAIEAPDDYSSRSQLMWAASLSLSGVMNAGLGKIGFPVHLLEHAVSAFANSTHGAGLAVLMPAWMKYQASVSPARISKLGVDLFNITSGSEKERAFKTARHFRALFQHMGLPVSLQDLGISNADHLAIAENAQRLAKLWRLREYNVDTILSILQLC